MVECPALAPIPNGDITYAPDMIAPYDVDTVAIHSCDPGFRLVGSETLVCLFGGIWSDQPPVCQRKIHFVIIIGSGKSNTIMVQKYKYLQSCMYTYLCQERISISISGVYLEYHFLPVHALHLNASVHALHLNASVHECEHAHRLCVIKPTVCDVLADRCSCSYILATVQFVYIHYIHILYSAGMSSTSHYKRSYFILP